MSKETRHPAQRVAVFIDVQNLYHSARQLLGGRLDFKAVLEEAVAGRQLVRALAYVVTTPEDQAERIPFFDFLSHIGIEPRIKELRIYADGHKKADWDVGMTVDAIRLAPGVDTAVLLTGDGDFLPLVEHLQGLGKRVEIMAFSQTTSEELKRQADGFYDLGKDPERFLYKPMI